MRRAIVAVATLACAACAQPERHRFAFSLDAGASAAPDAAIVYVAPSQDAALAWQAAVDNVARPTWTQINVGGGIFAPLDASATQHQGEVIQSASTGQWGYVVRPSDSISMPAIAPNAVTLGVPAAVPFDSTWYPVINVVGLDLGTPSDASAPDAGGTVSIDAGGQHATDSGVAVFDGHVGPGL